MSETARLLNIDAGLRVHLGCGLTHFDGWLNVDHEKHSPHVDEAFDLMEPWPLESNSVSAVYASHVLEHLPDPLFFFRELWRVMMPMGSVLLRLPHGGHKSAWADITHLRIYYPESFAFLQPGYAESIGNPQLMQWQACFGIGGIDVRVVPDLVPWLRHFWFRKVFVRLASLFPSWGEELFVDLYPLKTPDAKAQYRSTHTPNVVPMRYVAFRHHFEDRPIQPGEKAAMVPVAEPREVDRMSGYR
jgi:SAM-dependent methyltransferase